MCYRYLPQTRFIGRIACQMYTREEDERLDRSLTMSCMATTYKFCALASEEGESCCLAWERGGYSTALDNEGSTREASVKALMEVMRLPTPQYLLQLLCPLPNCMAEIPTDLVMIVSLLCYRFAPWPLQICPPCAWPGWLPLPRRPLNVAATAFSCFSKSFVAFFVACALTCSFFCLCSSSFSSLFCFLVALFSSS
jgi:hypothetical protein